MGQLGCVLYLMNRKNYAKEIAYKETCQMDLMESHPKSIQMHETCQMDLIDKVIQRVKMH